MSTREVHRVGEVPVLAYVPDAGVWVQGLVVWLPFLGGTKEAFVPLLERAAARGFVGIGIDPRRHGERADATERGLREEVMARFRAVMWPILGGTTRDVVRVLDWAQDRYGPDEPVLAGGVSMGGDIAVALAGVDSRVRRVVAIAATPDWARPGMTLLGDPETVIDQGEPSQTGQQWYDELDPITHAEAFGEGLHLRFDVGANDTHVPGEAAHRFTARLAAASPSARVEVVEHPGLDHLDVATDAAVLDQAATWLLDADL